MFYDLCTLYVTYSEAAWELQDILKRAYQVLILKNGAHPSAEAMAFTKVSPMSSNSFKLANQMGM